MLQLLTETIIYPLIDYTKALVFYTLSQFRKVKEWKKQYIVSQRIVWLIYYQSIYWLSLAFIPYIALAMPLFMYLLFKLIYYDLKHFKLKPRQGSNDYQTGFLIMILLNATFVMIMVFYGFLFYFSFDHEQYASDSSKQCGMFETNTYMFEDVDSLL